jgi:hypothetical protein
MGAMLEELEGSSGITDKTGGLSNETKKGSGKDSMWESVRIHFSIAEMG